MWDTIKNISLFIIISLLINLGSISIESNFLNNFINSSLITILITLLAISITTSGILLTRLAGLKLQFPKIDISAVTESLHRAFYEQVVLIIVAIILLICKNSVLLENHFKFHAITFNTLLTTVFIDSISVLIDLGKSIFKVFKQ
jgi:hypothetical protein